MGVIKEMTHGDLVRRVLKNEKDIVKLKDDLITIGVLMEVIGTRLCNAGKKIGEDKK